MRIGIDFDNTIVSYGALFEATAARFGFLSAAAGGRKTAIRDALRARPGGEQQWQELQAAVYGPALADAPPFPGAAAFLARARRHGARLFLISHKSQCAAAGRERVDLRLAARAWLGSNGMIGESGFAEDDLYFADTRAEKIERIAQLGCTHAIDDLEEVLGDPAFPAGVQRWLFAPDGAPAGPWRTVRTWDDVSAALFPDA